jgi:uncharacterized protein DUF6314
MDPIAVLAGRWEVRRRLLDLATGAQGEFAGEATIGADGSWTESGRLRFGAYDGAAGRRLWIDGDVVRFEDGRVFHALDLASGSCTVEHLCGDDRYAGEYTLRGPDALDVVWYVAGPRKRLLIDAIYRRG